MKSTYIDQIKSQAVVQDFFLVKSIAFKVGKNGKEYLDMTVGDKTGEVSCKKWEIGDDLDVLKSIDEGDIIKLRASVGEWNGSKQLSITKINTQRPYEN